MIIDKVENFRLYNFGSVWERIFQFLNILTHDTNDGKYAIEGEDIFAIVMSYHTSLSENVAFESHQKYIDIQTAISGGERFECDFSDELEIATPYDADKDVTFYERISKGQVQADIFPGRFIVLFSNDSHIAGISINGESELVKKVVVKVKKELLIACNKA